MTFSSSSSSLPCCCVFLKKKTFFCSLQNKKVNQCRLYHVSIYEGVLYACHSSVITYFFAVVFSPAKLPPIKMSGSKINIGQQGLCAKKSTTKKHPNKKLTSSHITRGKKMVRQVKTLQEFKEVINGAGDKLVVVDFWATWYVCCFFFVFVVIGLFPVLISV